ncbi:SA1788 family PVL leukocidin-associated protein [Staphylococcus warneri]|uniref:SA1788 family PVL leukocidin-associated protein n=1 Tax=Staphylococcus warneri TaxID=1292 RepID=UPI0021ADDC43|nr:SA1788 family PVL leukocidin-associated protein [Staphylococcus warneri]UUY68649.1 SA1788 family PVL leukocidin-associated protein [Staphylococcus warneri]
MVRTVERYRDKYGNIYVPLSINSTKVDVPIEIYETAINNGLSDYDIRRRIIENGYKPTYFIARPINADKGAMKLEIEEKEREQRIATREEQELRRKKPHLFNVPQKHKRSIYARSLENNLIARVKIDSYGRVQRG